jgi:protein MpaA
VIDSAAYLAGHRAHDYAWLVRRWKGVARKARLSLDAFAENSGFTLHVLRPRTDIASDHGLYLSAGIHGDEPAAALGLLEWAEENTEFLREADVLLFPCLNPWGLVNNVRVDHRGRDLNREFQNGRANVIRQWRGIVGNRRFTHAAMLHEDYDALGAYIYEVSHTKQGIGEQLLSAVADIIPPDTRTRIDVSRAKNGVIRRKVTPENFPLPGLPEAIYLHFHHADTTVTFETPSEFCLYERVRAQRTVLEKLVEIAGR